VSCVNHHVSILKLTVHKAFLEYIETAKLPAEEDVEDDWSSPVLQRTRWYDLMSPVERVEAFRGLWGLAGYLSQPV
jgi:hypothetical protein